MHKIFAKPIFLGKKVVFLPQCHSTNDELSLLSKQENLPEGTVVYTDHQVAGKGQRGNSWKDEPAKNILASLLLKPKRLLIRQQHYLNLITGLAVVELLSKYLDAAKLKLKWPNDVYIEGNKVAGILIENTIKGQTIDSAIVGVGVNLNQLQDLPEKATSVKKELGATPDSLDRLDFMEDLLSIFEKWYLKLGAGEFTLIDQAYDDVLYWKNEVHMFQADGKRFDGVIRGINEIGRLQIETNDGQLIFDVKEVQFID